MLLRGSALFALLTEDPGFVAALTETLSAIDRIGTRNVLAAAVEEESEAMSA